LAYTQKQVKRNTIFIRRVAQLIIKFRMKTIKN
jgi:hypothetical protein